MSIAIITTNLITQWKRLRGRAGKYLRANGHEIPLIFVPAKRISQIVVPNGRLQYTSHDWLMLLSDLVDGAEKFLPVRREQIRITDPANSSLVIETYEVRGEQDFPEWEKFDSAGVAIRIRTKEIT